MQIREIEYQSNFYKQALDLRFKILRKPLGLEWSKKDLDCENLQIHIATIDGDRVVGNVTLKPISKTRLKLRQMAIDDNFQGSGIGRKLVEFAEKIAISKNFSEIEMIARVSAIGFYQKLGYKTIGEEFEEVTVQSINMIKYLR